MDPIQVIVEAFPWLKGVVDTASVVISAIPGFFQGLYDTATVAITARPYSGLPFWLFGLLGAGFLVYAWNALGLGDWRTWF